MRLPARRWLRNAALTCHIIASVGWLGTVVAFLALALIGAAEQDPSTAAACYIAARAITWTAILPLAIGALVTGVISAFGSPWGLLQHYWVLFKLLLTLVATGVLILHTKPIDHMAFLAAQGALGQDTAPGQLQLILASAGGLVVVAVVTVLSVYKPRGLVRSTAAVAK